MAKKAARAEQDEGLNRDEGAQAEPDSAIPDSAIKEGASDAVPGADEEGAPDAQAALAAAQDEVASLKDAVLRAQAEVDNMRRRAARDVESARKFALERFAGDLLPVLDSLEKSVESAPSATDAAAVSEGVGLCLKLFIDTLAKNGIEQVDPLGEPFDPSQSEAMAMVENPDAEPNSVMEVMQKGYALNGRLVRAAKVIVAKAPASAAPAD